MIGKNEIFTIFSGPAGSLVEELSVFDRWGNLVYIGENFVIGDSRVGWDGRFKGKLVNSGVFAWVAKVRFVDNVVVSYNGSITVAR